MAHDFLVSELKYPRGSVIAYGESFGAGTTSELSKQRPLKALILESPLTSPKDWADQHLYVSEKDRSLYQKHLKQFLDQFSAIRE